MTKPSHFLLVLALTGICLGPLAGCDRDDIAAKKVGSAVGGAVTDFGKGVVQGVDRRLEVKIELAEGLKKAGLNCTTAKISLENGAVQLSAYLIAEGAVKGDIVAKAINPSGKEIGRSVVPVDLPADAAQYINFVFPKEMDSQLVEHYLLAEPKPALGPEKQ